MRRAVCPGSFDPVTNGHLDIVRRASTLFDEVVVAVGVNASKNRLFSPEERIALLTEACREFDNVQVDSFSGLLTRFCEERDIHAIVKGLRAVSDFDYELQMAQMNASLAPVETVFLPTSPQHSPRPPGGICASASSPSAWGSAAPTSRSPRPAPCASSSPRATAACARRFRGC